MAHTKQAKKRIRTDEKRRLRNRVKSSAMKTVIKKVTQAVEAGDRDTAAATLPMAHKLIDKAGKSRIVHPNKASRMKSKLSRSVAAIGS